MSDLPPDLQKLPYRPCAGLMLIKDRKVFVGERLDYLGSWQMPQGGVDPGETIQQAAMRELQEEVGTNKAHIVKIAPHTIKYDLPAQRIPQFWNGRYRGQEQTWVALAFDGDDTDIDLDTHHEPEFNQWKWASKQEALDTIVPFKKPSINRSLPYFQI